MKPLGLKIAVVGATGAVGRQVLQILAERDFPAHEVVALASDQSKGKQVSYGEDRVLDVQPLSAYSFKGTHIAFFAAGGKISQQYAPLAVQAGAYVIGFGGVVDRAIVRESADFYSTESSLEFVLSHIL